MNRCHSFTRQFVSHLQAIASLAVLFTTLSTLPATVLAQAQTGAQADPSIRPFPVNALRGKLLVVAPPDIRIDGRVEKLAPGARIRDLQNMFIMSGALIGREFTVNFTREPSGLVRDIWVLSEADRDARAQLPLCF